VGFAQTLLGAPETLLLDEPTSGLVQLEAILEVRPAA
jgi:ABC-type multidrug transport system ATPase subunit